MGSNCSRVIAKNFRDELWSYTALSGLLFLHIGIVLMVYALKRATPYTTVIKTFGIGLIVLGVLATLASWYAHRQHRLQRDLCLCCSCCQTRPVKKPANQTGGIPATTKQQSSGRSSVKKNQPAPEHTLKLFSAPEFQRYAEFINGTTAGVQQGSGRGRGDSQRHKKIVHPQQPRDLPQTELIVNPRFLQSGQQTQQLAPGSMPSPIFLTLS